MGIALAILYPGEVQGNAITIFLFIGKLTVDEFVGLVHGTRLYQPVGGKDAIDNMDILVRRAYLEGDRLTVVGEPAIRLIEPVVGLCGRTFVVEGEHHEVAL